MIDVSGHPRRVGLRSTTQKASSTGQLEVNLIAMVNIAILNINPNDNTGAESIDCK